MPTVPVEELSVERLAREAQTPSRRDWRPDVVQPHDVRHNFDDVDFTGLDVPAGRITAHLVFNHEHLYPVYLRKAFGFLRQGRGAYSNRTQMQVLRQAEEAEAYLHPGEETHYVIILEAPPSYDEETEVKSGGIMAVSLSLPSEVQHHKHLLTVAPQYRRRGIGTAMLDAARRYGVGLPVLWVGRNNIGGQRFLTQTGHIPYRVNDDGAICYTRHIRTTQDYPDVEDEV